MDRIIIIKNNYFIKYYINNKHKILEKWSEWIIRYLKYAIMFIIYLDYECYHKLNDRFILGNLNVASSVTDFSSKHEVSYTKNSTLFNQILPKLKKYLSDDHSFSSYDHLHICKYISYLLYDEICKNDYNVCDENMFNTFKNFVDGYRKHSTSNICESKINYLSPSTYQKHKTLYDLYDKYNILIGQITSTQYIRCSTLHSLTFHYNEALRSHGESDVNFIDKLIELKKLIEAKVLQSKTDCGRNLPHFNETNIEKARAKELAEKQLREAAEAEKQKQIREAAEAEKQKKIREAAEAAQQQQQQQRILSRPDDEITIVPSQRQALKSLPQGPYEESGAYRQPELAEGLTSEDEKSNEIDEQLHGPKNVWGTSPGGEEGIMGHSLEEEEELTIESPVRSMDNLQEDLQDMMIFMKEVLDQVQLI
ncbi:hypothetical protein PVNG_06176 [Plasmodium vivax North Korean]|uniref:Uncharacterized protein n=1 Tax=Plasmodium vivax North Korean TaxID=1035514 RepID=A0A0J9U003_PLAVI|nr:hypothetical protein PVNG_06176 [Plasmodium vivax North Korean]